MEDERPERPEIILADALETFFYDLEMIGMRLDQLGQSIAPTMEALGYPKKGRKDR